MLKREENFTNHLGTGYKDISKPKHLLTETFMSSAVILWASSVLQKTAEEKRHLSCLNHMSKLILIIPSRGPQILI